MSKLEERVIGYRAWKVDDEGKLSSSNNHHDWEVGVNKAICNPPGSMTNRVRKEPHLAPDIDCECGNYAYYRPRAEAVRLGELLGPVFLWGEAVMHHERIRTEFAEVAAIIVPVAFSRTPAEDADEDERDRLAQEWARIDKAVARYQVPLLIVESPQKAIEVIEAEFGPHVPENLIPAKE